MLGCLLQGILELVLDLVLRAILLPATLILATPFVLVAALFGPADYGSNLRSRYVRVVEIWAYIVGH